MIGFLETGFTENVVFTGHLSGLTVTTQDGEPATLAVLDKNGVVVGQGPAVAKDVFNTSINTYKNFLIGEGHLKIYSKPPGRS